ncbi:MULTISPECIES: hypothetical protein [unclassified Bradyrhizobium]|uniref:hypothetical protein n=1 Tax=unclassified Bradyrhizobium TaxID=2631580 RepID=UPI001FFAB83E|nr:MULTISPECIES: hypothetical protein [unclassified Bradyrhizobium]
MAKEIKHLPSKTGPKKINPAQGTLDVYVDKQTEIQGIEMGVLSDGTPFLTQRGLARLCGVQNAHIGTIGAEWEEEIQKPRITTIKNLLSARGQTPTAPYFDVSDEKRQVYAYLFIPAVLLFPLISGFNGVLASQAIAELGAGMIALFVILRQFAELRRGGPAHSARNREGSST